VMGSDLGSTLNALFTAAPVEIPPPTVSRAPSAAEQTVAQAMAAGVAKPPPAGKGDLTGASMHYSRALAALKTGDWAQFGNEMQQLGTELNQPAEAAHH